MQGKKNIAPFSPFPLPVYYGSSFNSFSLLLQACVDHLRVVSIYATVGRLGPCYAMPLWAGLDF